MATVTNTIKLPDGTAPATASVEIELVASETASTGAAGWITASDITILSVARPTVTAGAWTASLTPNDDIDPAGTVYRVNEYVGRQRYVHHIDVGSGGGAVHDLLVDPPASVASSALLAHIDDTADAHDASAISVADSGSLFDGSNVETVLAELGGRLPWLLGASNDVDDTTAVAAAFASGRPVSFMAGETYIVRRRLSADTAGQVISGNGATLKRADQVSTTFATAVTANVTTSVTVASTAGLNVGDHVTVASVDHATYESGGTFTPLTISTIVGSVVTFDRAPNVTLGSGGELHSAYPQIRLAGDRCAVRDLRFDGNSAEWTFARWEQTSAIKMDGAAGIVEGCTIISQPGEGIFCLSDRSTISACAITDTNGNGVHFSGCSAPRLTASTIDTANLDTDVGHADGCVSISNDVADLTISGCELVGSTLAAVGGLDSADNSDLTIEGCTIRGCGSIIEAVLPVDRYVQGLVFTGNRCYDSGALEVAQSNTPATWPSRVVVTGNYLEDSRIKLKGVHDAVVTGNLVRWDANATDAMIEISGAPRRVNVSGNETVGGFIGVQIDGDTNGEPVMVASNLVRNATSRGITTRFATNGNMVTVQGNTVTSDSATMASGWIGIAIHQKQAALNNTVQADRASSGDYCISIGGTGDVFIQGNVLKGGEASIKQFGGTSGGVIQNNVYDTAPAIGGTHTVTGNVLVAF